jgi:pimeloyl-ACP methyl ester carboxylesterase
MVTFVIVHGAHSGGWLWQLVRNRMLAQGHACFTPTLTGVGERTHLARIGVDLDLHIHDIVAVPQYEDLSEVILVGHCDGGMVITGVADCVPERIARLIYLDTIVPCNGQSVLDLVPPALRTAAERMVQRTEDGVLMLPPLPAQPHGRIGSGGLSPEEIWQRLARRVPVAFATFTQPLRLTNAAVQAMPHCYILTVRTKDSMIYTLVWLSKHGSEDGLSVNWQPAITRS